MKKIFFSVMALLWLQWAVAQAPDTAWTRVYGGSGSESSSQMVENTDGDYFFACSSTSQPSEQRTAPRKGSRDMWVVKTDKDGNKIWDKAYGGGLITVTSMAATADGGFIVGANTQTSGTGIGADKSDTTRGGIDVWIIKLDRNGNKLWDKTLGGSENDNLGEIIVTPDGSILVAMITSSTVSGDKTAPGFGGTDCWVVKLNSSGQKIWDKTYGGSGFEGFYTGFVDKEGNYIFGGSSNSPVSGNKTEPSRGGDDDGWLVKTDANGNKIWDKTLGGDLTDYIQTMALTKEGEYVLGIISNSNISGDKTSTKIGGNDCWIVKVSKTGSILWQKTIGGDKSDYLFSVEIDKNGDLYLAIESSSGISGDKTLPFVGPGSDIWIVKTNENGNIDWQSSYEFAGLGLAKLTSDGNYVITGVRNAIYIIKIKTALNTGVFYKHETGKLIIFPNPSVNQISLQIEENQNNTTVIEVFDIEGKRIIQELIMFENGKSQWQFDLENGVYLLNIILPNKIYAQKFVVSK